MAGFRKGSKRSNSLRDNNRSNRRDSDDTPRFERGKNYKKGGRGSRSSGRRDSGRGRPRKSARELPKVKVVCDGCGCNCEVPFKPSSDKPVYCDKCFKKGGRSSDRHSRSQISAPSDSGRDYSKEIEIINQKLDKIMKALDL